MGTSTNCPDVYRTWKNHCNLGKKFAAPECGMKTSIENQD
jgi:hypothetical protein